jgi:chitinase
MIGYYQASNVRDRACNKVYPKDIKTEAYTHLYWAFASIDPVSFNVKLWNSADEEHVREFTKLKGKGRNLQTWVAVGGYDFSNEGATHTTWSDLCADAGYRQAFIKSATSFMDKYGFQGIDLDWEYPVEPKRGGRKGDTKNFNLLLKEMRAAWGNKYGISLTIAPDYWYLRYFDVKGLEPYVDHFGFMAYDLHGFWDSDVKTLAPVVRGQADIREIYNNTIPLAYPGVDFGKIVFGVAWYGRGYTLSDPSCNTLGCNFAGPSKPAKCTNSAGVMSLSEVQDMIKNGATSRLLKDSAMKELVFDDQWIGYDDEETVEMKRKFANNYCFGGLMAWSVDFEPGTGGSDDGEPAKSTDGRCGPNFKGTTCVGTSYGECCSEGGWCGDSEGHCGTGCISGKCKKGGTSTNGRCGAGFGDAKCLGTSYGPCCSAGGWCGDSDAHCGDGCQSGCDGNDGEIDLPNKGTVNDQDADRICGYKFDSKDPDVVRKSWKDSGAADWWEDFIYDTGAEDWSNKFFQEVMADGKQGGSTFDCTEFILGNCPGPGTKACNTYHPPEAFYMHIQIGNLFDAFEKIWMDTVEQAIKELSKGIKQIVKDYGTPPTDSNGAFLNMLVGILTSLAGFGVTSPMIAGPTTALAGMFASMGSGIAWDEQVTPDTLNDKLESAYGEMFETVMKKSQDFIEKLFRGDVLSNWSGGGVPKVRAQYVYNFFKDADWLSKEITTPAVKNYIAKAQKKWDEFAVVKAMKSGNKADYFLMVSDEDTQCSKSHGGVGSFPLLVDMSEDICKNKMEGCLWHDDRCLCFGSRQNSVPSVATNVHSFQGDDLKKFKDYVLDYEAALKNNYDCVKYIIDNKKKCYDAFGDKPDGCKIQDTVVPGEKDLDAKNPLQYTKCWFNLPPIIGHNFACGWKE